MIRRLLARLWPAPAPLPAPVGSVSPRAITQTNKPNLGLVSNSLPLPLTNGYASKVVCMEVLEHIDQPEPFMAELVRMGRPGTQYLLSVPAQVDEHFARKPLTTGSKAGTAP